MSALGHSDIAGQLREKIQDDEMLYYLSVLQDGNLRGFLSDFGIKIEQDVVAAIKGLKIRPPEFEDRDEAKESCNSSMQVRDPDLRFRRLGTGPHLNGSLTPLSEGVGFESFSSCFRVNLELILSRNRLEND